MQEIQSRGPIRYGVVGLGAGVMSGYARKGDFVRIYEINPIVPVIAKSEFQFFPHSEADKDILMGDARLVMEKQVSNSPQYDVLVIDAFSSDAIPVHLLTKESFELYGKLLKPNGVLAVHISNRYLDLAPVCQKGADALGRKAMVVYDEGDQYSNSTTWVLITADASIFQAGSFTGANIYPPAVPAGFKAWTDDYSNIVSILSLN
jgi:spermidine synthase